MKKTFKAKLQKSPNKGGWIYVVWPDLCWRRATLKETRKRPAYISRNHKPLGITLDTAAFVRPVPKFEIQKAKKKPHPQKTRVGHPNLSRPFRLGHPSTDHSQGRPRKISLIKTESVFLAIRVICQARHEEIRATPRTPNRDSKAQPVNVRGRTRPSGHYRVLILPQSLWYGGAVQVASDRRRASAPTE
jgi:hypothetical protein